MIDENPKIRLATEDGQPVEIEGAAARPAGLPPDVIAAIAAGLNPIRAIRTHRGMTQLELAVAVGVDPVVISHIERGYRAVTDEQLRAIASALGVDVEDLRG